VKLNGVPVILDEATFVFPHRNESFELLARIG
jgi:hypothetical protein